MQVYKFYCDVCKAEIKESYRVELVVDREIKIALDLCANHFQQLHPKILAFIQEAVEAMKKP